MKSIRKIIKFNNDEWQAVCKRADFLNMKIGTYIRVAAVQEILKVFDMKKYNQVLVSFFRIGNLLEQILRVAIKEQSQYTVEIKKLIKVCRSSQNKLLKYLSELKSERLL